MSLSPLRLGVAGLGRAFSLMLPTFLRDPRIVLAAACDPRAAAREQFARDFNARVYDDIEALADDASLDAIYIASPHQFHARHAEIAAARGKHVLVEKPMALAMDECDRMIDACARAGVHLIVGHCHSFDMPYLKTRELIASGEFGAVRMIHALNYTDYLYRPRRPEELVTAEGGGAVFSQAAHQVDIVRLLAGARPTHLRAAVGNWDPRRPTEGAYSAMLWFESGAYASMSYNGYAHFDSDEWTNWIGEMGNRKSPDDYGTARRKLAAIASPEDEAKAKADATYGGTAYRPPGKAPEEHAYQHFGPIIVSCEQADLRPMPDGIAIYGDDAKRWIPLDKPAVPRHEVIDELTAAVQQNVPPRHDGRWAKATLEICLAILESSASHRDIALTHQVA